MSVGWIELNSSIKGVECLLVAVKTAAGITPGIVGISVMRIELQRALICDQGFFVMTTIVEGIAFIQPLLLGFLTGEHVQCG